MKTRTTLLSFLSVGLLALTIIGALLAITPGSASAQRPVKQRPQPTELPVVEPLKADDPRAQLGQEWMSAEAMPFPVSAVSGAADENPLATAEAAFDFSTGQQELGNKPAKAALFNRAVMPSNLGPNADVDAFDLQFNQPNDDRNGDRANSVIGDDNRTRISPTTSFPWRAMTKLRMTFPSGRQFICSGAMVAAKYTLTAGHCVFSHDEGGWATSIEVIPGLDGTYKPYGSAYATRMRSYQGWTQNRDANHDFALLTLDRTIGNSTGWFGYANYSSVDGLTANLGGYPGDRDSGLRLYYHSNPVVSSTSHRVSYTTDTAGGQSGSGVYRINNGSRYIFAVHTNGGTTSNSGTRITSSRFSDLQTWISSGQ
jgi:glutamyl endopeptidase